jgi:pilus assembly protein CpaB
MRAKSILLLVLALGCGLVASIGITQMVGKHGEDQPPSEDSETIVLATQDIGMGDPIQPEMLRLEQWPNGKAPPGVLKKIEDLQGRRSRTAIAAGAPVLENQLLDKNADFFGPSMSIPRGYRAVPVKIDPTIGSANMLRPGDHVDVLVHGNPDAGGNPNNAGTQTILQNMRVFAIDNQYDAKLSGDKGDKPAAVKIISLLATPEESEILLDAQEWGKIQLVMRSPDDKEIVTLAGIRPPPAVKDEIQPAPPAAPPTPAAPVPEPHGDLWTMRIISGAQCTDAELECVAYSYGDGSHPDHEMWKVNRFATVLPVGAPTETPKIVFNPTAAASANHETAQSPPKAAPPRETGPAQPKTTFRFNPETPVR